MSKQMLVIVGALAATFFAGIAIGFFLASDAFDGFSEHPTEVQINWTTQPGKQLYTWKVINNGSESSDETPSDWMPDSGFTQKISAPDHALRVYACGGSAAGCV